MVRFYAQSGGFYFSFYAQVFIIIISIFSWQTVWRNWQDWPGSGGKVQWAPRCAFNYGKELDDEPTTLDQCVKLCLGNANCNYFTYRNDHCHLKWLTWEWMASAVEVDEDEVACGYVTDRVNEHVVGVLKIELQYNLFFQVSSRMWFGGENFKVTWAYGCDYYGNDIASLSIANGKCGRSCLNNKECTHFTWLDGTCYLKHVSNRKDAKDFNVDGAFCGFIETRTGA